jgi:hypothetical protein
VRERKNLCKVSIEISLGKQYLRDLGINERAVLNPVVYSASNRNEYQKHKNNNVSGE